MSPRTVLAAAPIDADHTLELVRVGQVDAGGTSYHVVVVDTVTGLDTSLDGRSVPTCR